MIDLLKTKSPTFSDLYVAYAKDQTDAPPVFHRFLSYLILSSVINRNVYMPFGYKKLHPNVFLLIVAPSSAHRKSWSIGMACHLINQITKDFVIPETSSREAFVSELADTNRVPFGSGLVRIDELKGFMDRVKTKSYMEGFIQDLSSLYDGDYLNRRKGIDKPERFRVEDPFLNMVAACSTDWLYQAIQTGDISGGFLARFIWVVYDEKIDRPSALPKRPDEMKFHQLIMKLQRMREYIGSIDFDPEALQFYENWYQTFYRTHQGGLWDANYHRAAVIIQKIAALNALMRTETYDILLSGFNGVGIVISVNDIKNAIVLIEDSLLNFQKLTIGVNKFDTLTKKVLKFIVNKGETNRASILTGVRGISAKFLTDILMTLQQSETIEITQRPDRLGGTRITANGTASEYLNF